MATSSKAHQGLKYIWIIEDNPDHWVLIQTALKQSLPQVQAIWLPGFTQTLDYLELEGNHQQPSLIFLDWYLPHREQGQKLLQRLKERTSVVFLVPVVVLSVSTDPEDINQTYTQGSASFVPKPQTMEGWMRCFQTMTHYWWEIVTLPDQTNY